MKSKSVLTIGLSIPLEVFDMISVLWLGKRHYVVVMTLCNNYSIDSMIIMSSCCKFAVRHMDNR